MKFNSRFSLDVVKGRLYTIIMVGGWEYLIIVHVDNYDDDDSYIGSDSITVERKEEEQKDPFLKRVLIVDDDPDITLTFKAGLDWHYYDKRRFAVYTYNNPARALSQFKPNFYDLLLTDINMPHMNGFELCEKIVEIDVNIRVCFMSAAEVNIEALREVYPKARSIGCFIKKPVTISHLVKRLLAELDWLIVLIQL